MELAHCAQDEKIRVHLLEWNVRAELVGEPCLATLIRILIEEFLES